MSAENNVNNWGSEVQKRQIFSSWLWMQGKKYLSVYSNQAIDLF